jgi:steroid delta-isomerase-like uncharacterized protein
MSIESTRDVMMKYWDSAHSDTSMMADDVVFTMMPTGEETRTPQGVLGLLNYFYHVAFDAAATVENSIIGDGSAMMEGHVTGTHIGEFAGIPATGKEIRVPICVSYDLKDDKIQRARIYFEMPVLMQQLGVA